MAGDIKGITVELNGDTIKPDRALHEVHEEIGTVQRQLPEMERIIKMDPGNNGLIKQKQRLLGEKVKELIMKKINLLLQKRLKIHIINS